MSLLMKKDAHHLHDLCLGKTSQLCPGGGNCRKRRLDLNIKILKYQISKMKESKYQSIKYQAPGQAGLHALLLADTPQLQLHLGKMRPLVMGKMRLMDIMV